MIQKIYEKWHTQLISLAEYKSYPLLQNRNLCLKIIESIISENGDHPLLLPSLINYVESYNLKYQNLLRALEILKADILPRELPSEKEKVESGRAIDELVHKLDIYFGSLQSDMDKVRWDRLFTKLDLLGATVLELDDQFIIRKSNSSIEHFFGYKKIEIIDTHFKKLFAHSSQPIITNALRELQQGHRFKIELELEAQGKSGRRFQALLKIIPQNWQLPVKTYSAYIQKSEHLKFAKDSSHILLSALANIKEGIVIWDPLEDNKILFINEAFEKITGYSRYDLVNQSFAKFIKTENQKEKKEFLRKCKTSDDSEKEVFISCKDDSTCRVLLSNKIIKTEFYQSHAMVSNITIIKKDSKSQPVENNVAQNINNLIYAFPNPILITNKKMEIQHWNPAGEKEFNLKSKFKQSRNFFDAISFPKSNRIEDEIQKEIDENDCFTGKFYSKKRSKSDKYYLVQIVPFRLNSKELLFWSIQDNTKIEESNHKIIKQNASLRFLENFSRIINNNLELASILQLFVQELQKIFNFQYLSFLLPYYSENRYFQLYYLYRLKKENFPQNHVIDISKDRDFQNLIQNETLMARKYPENFHHVKGLMNKFLIPDSVRELIQIPIIFEGKILGILIIGTGEDETFHKEDLNFIQQITKHLAIALKNNIYFKYAELQKNKFFIINSIFHAPHTENSILHICQNTLTGFLDLLNCQSGGLYRSSDGENWQKIILKQAKGILPQSLKLSKSLLAERTIFWDNLSFLPLDEKLSGLSKLSSSGMFSWESSSSFGYIAFVLSETPFLNQMDRTFITTLIEDILKQMVVALDQIILFEKVKMAENEWETTFKTVDIGLVVVDENLQIIRTNQAFLNLYNCDFSEILGKTCSETFCKNGIENEILRGKSKLKRDKQNESEYYDEKINKMVLRTFYPFHNTRGNFKGGIFTIQDVTEKHHQQQKITFLSRFPENNPNIVMSLDENGKILYINPSMLRILKNNNLSEESINQLIPADLELIFQRMKASKSKAVEIEHKYKDRFFQYIIYYPSENDNYYMYGMDITEKLNLQKQLIQTERIRALGEMAAGVAHDFNNLLATIIGRTQLILIKTEKPEILRELKVIEKAAMEGGQIVKRLQEVTREKRESNFQTLDINELIKESIIFAASKLKISTQLKNQKVHLYTELQNNLMVKGEPVELKEVFTNLMLNAFDAMPNGGDLFIKSHKVNKNSIRIIFKDSGNGMPEEIRNKIFNPFFTTKGDKGTGLGLSIAYKNITTHGGSIKVESQVNKGSTFTITLPSTVDIIKPKDKKKLKMKDKISEANLLIVDDEPELLETMAEILRLKFGVVEIAANGKEALHKTKKQKFDVILTDLGMPEMSGWELARKIKVDLPEANIILVTGWGDQAKEEQKHHPYIDEILPKPYMLNELIEKINLVLTH